MTRRGLILLLFLSAFLNAQQNEIHFNGESFSVTRFTGGLEPAGGWAAVFPIYAAGNQSQPMAGIYSLKGNTLTFRPRFPIVAGVAYQASLLRNGEVIATTFFDPPPSSLLPSTHVVAVYPSADKLPVNTLRLYIHFSGPMSRGEAWQHIHLRTRDAAGRFEDTRLAFLEIEQELWDPELRRLTLLFDPGRIKRGLAPGQQLGSPLRDGLQYSLVIDKDWHDARGTPLTDGFEKSFAGVAADRTPPAPKLWRLSAPRAHSMEPLIVTFPKAMDSALLQRMIHVESLTGHSVIGKHETEWRFTPDAPWKPGRYTLSAESAIEDIAGNRPGRAFDVDLSRDAPASATEKDISIPFTVR